MEVEARGPPQASETGIKSSKKKAMPLGQRRWGGRRGHRERISSEKQPGGCRLILRVDTVFVISGYRGCKAKKALHDEERIPEPGSNPSIKRLVGTRASKQAANCPGWAQVL